MQIIIRRATSKATNMKQYIQIISFLLVLFCTTLSHANTYPDDFNRVDGDLGTNWTAFPGFSPLTISGNEVVSSDGSERASYWSNNTFSSDQYAQITATTLDSNVYGASIYVRCATSGFVGYFLNFGSSAWNIYKSNGVSQGLLVTDQARSISNGTTVRLTIVDSTLYVSFDGNVEYQYTDTETPIPGGHPGISLTGTTATADNWVCGDVPMTSNTTIGSSSNPSNYGSSVTFTATVTGGIVTAPTPTGSVTFMDGVTTLSTETLNGSGLATYLTSTLSAGISHSITAVYSGDTFYSSSTSSAIDQTVNKANSSVTAWPTASAITYGQTLASSTLTGGTSTPAGTFAFTTPSTAPSAGTASQGVTFTPTDTTNYNTADGTVSVTVNKADQTITFANPGAQTFGTTPTLTATGGASGNAVTFTSSTTGVCTITSGGVLTFVAAGSCTINADQAGNGNYNAAPQVTQTFTVNKADQTITFGALSNKAVGDANYAPGGTASSGLTVSYASSDAGVATIMGGNIHIVSAGTTTITASQAGDTNYNAATPVLQGLTVAAGNQTITVGTHAPASAAFNSTFNVSAAASSTLPVAITTSGGCSGSGSGSATITMTSGTTSCTVNYNQAGNANYSAAPQLAENTTAQMINQSALTAIVTPSTIAYGSTAALSSSGGSGTGAVTYGAGASTGCSVSGTTLNVTNASGTCSVTATKAADTNYNVAVSTAVYVTLTVMPGDLNKDNTVGVTDALKALRIAAGLDTPTASDIAHGDVAPLVNGIRTPDGKIDISDVVAILRKAVNLPSW